MERQSVKGMLTDIHHALNRVYVDQKAVILMILAQLVTSLVSANAKILQQGGLSAEQVLLGGMGIKLIFILLYMVTYNVPDAPFGPHSCRGLLILRGFAGSVGIFGFYYSLPFLPISVATVITFLAPMLGTFGITILLKTPFSRFQCIALFLSFAGVLIIAKPWAIEEVDQDIPGLSAAQGPAQTPTTAIQHAIAAGTALVGAFGSAIGIVALSKVGTAAHPIISVAYFSVTTTCVSASVFVIRHASTGWPTDPMVWIRLLLQGIGSFSMQLLGATSITMESGTRALNAVYSQVVFAMVVDKIVWGIVPDWLSIAAGAVVLFSVIGVAVSARSEKASLDSEADSPEQIELLTEH